MNKVCTKCGKEKELNTTNFIYREDLEWKCWEGRCRECNKKYLSEYYNTHKLKASKYAKRLYKKNRKHILSKSKEYYKKNKEYKIKYAREYYKLHPEIAKMYTRKRKALKHNVKEHYTHEDELYTRKLFKNKCAHCGSTKELTIDHHYPLSKGNPLTRQNAVLLCHSCNSDKRAKTPSEFYPARVLRIIERKLGLPLVQSP